MFAGSGRRAVIGARQSQRHAAALATIAPMTAR